MPKIQDLVEDMKKQQKNKDALREYNDRLAVVEKYDIKKHKGSKKYKKFDTLDMIVLNKAQDLSQSVDFSIHG